ncbi:hypothetical protein Golax_008303 [Gossypium laxum]|uniref:Uncharacterized protein n=1 Tax=Gossypium laxum TaxID=34288 RepID=A0A7J9AB04_9ROSI|nr:hypothetical protein [Gossypium laxum]
MELGDCCLTSSPASGEKRKLHRTQQKEKPFRGIRMRKWGKLNFPDLIFQEDELRDVSAASIRKKATEVGAKVDALQTSLHHASASSSESSNPTRVFRKPDLNKYPDSSDED